VAVPTANNSDHQQPLRLFRQVPQRETTFASRPWSTSEAAIPGGSHHGVYHWKTTGVYPEKMGYHGDTKNGRYQQQY